MVSRVSTEVSMSTFIDDVHASAASDEDDGNQLSSEDSDGDEPAEVPQQHPRPNAIYNTAALHDKLEEIGWPDDVNWLQTLTLNYNCDGGEIDVNDDLAREMAFYTQALEGSREAYINLQSLGVPFLRPADYYAEMVKSDSHMLKVKDALLTQQKQLEEEEERRKSREAKRFSKEVQAQKLKQRAKEKKQNIESVTKWRKMRQDKGFDGDDDTFPEDLDDGDMKGNGRRSVGKKRKHNVLDGEDSRKHASQDNRSPKRIFVKGNKGNVSKAFAPWDRSGGKNNKAGKGKVSKNRQARDAKYGYGGRKKIKKANTADSSAGFSGTKGFKGKERRSQKRK